MNEYTIHIDSTEGLATEEGLSAMHEALTGNPQALGAAVGIDQAAAYGATFQVIAPMISVAGIYAETAFSDALEEAGHPRSAIAHIDVVAPAAVAA